MTEPSTATRIEADTPTAPRTCTVLLVEDDGPIRGLVGEVLRSEGYDVMAVEDGHAAITALQRHRPPPEALCLVLLDMMLPGADGAQVLRALAELGSYVPVVAMSADRGQLARAREAGVHTTLPKPFDLDRLLTVVARNCGRVA